MSAREPGWWCDDCNAITTSGSLLRAAHPFDKDDVVTGCPECFGMDLRLVCDEPGCTRLVTCGTPTPTGYRSTCSQHKPEVAR